MRVHRWGRGIRMLAGGLVLSLGLTACSSVGQCEYDAYGTGFPVTVMNPDGIGRGPTLRGHNYGDICHAFPSGSFTAIPGTSLYRYQVPPELWTVLTGGWYCHSGTLLTLDLPRLTRMQAEVAQKLRTCQMLRGATREKMADDDRR